MTSKNQRRSTHGGRSPNDRPTKRTPPPGTPVNRAKTGGRSGNQVVRSPPRESGRAESANREESLSIEPTELDHLLACAANSFGQEDDFMNESKESEFATATTAAPGRVTQVHNPYLNPQKTMTGQKSAVATSATQQTGTSATRPLPQRDGWDNEEENDEEDGEDEGEEVDELMPLEVPQSAKPKPHRPFMARYDVKLSVSPVDNTGDAPEALGDAIQIFLGQLKEIDNSLVIYPWAEGSKRASISNIDNIPFKPSDLKCYFDRALPRKNGGVLYVSVYMGHTESFKKIHSDVKYWLDGEGFGWYYKALQVERAVCIGWLMYSDLDTDCEMLAQEIFKMCGAKVGLRYRAISVKTSMKLTPAQLVKAVHVEIDKRYISMDQDRLEILYSVNGNGPFPLGRKFRLVPQIQDITNPRSAAKIDRARLRQAGFLANVTRVANDDIGVLDFADPGLNGTLRDLIMKIPSESDPTKSLFVSVDRHFTGQGVMFRFTEQNHDEAKSRINGMLPYLKAMMPGVLHSNLEKCFTPEAVLRSDSCQWDPESKCVISGADKRIASLSDAWDELDGEYNFPETDMSAFVLDLSEIKSAAKASTNKDSDSISTFASRRASAAKKNSSPAMANQVTGEIIRVSPPGRTSGIRSSGTKSSGDTINSEASYNTLASRLSNVEASLEGYSQSMDGYTRSIQSDIKNLNQMVALLIQGSQNTQPQQPGQVSLDTGLDAGGRNVAGAGPA